MSNSPEPPHNEGILEMYHFYESIESIEQGLNDMISGLRDFQAGLENLHVLFNKIEELAKLSQEAELSSTDVEDADPKDGSREDSKMWTDDNLLEG